MDTFLRRAGEVLDQHGGMSIESVTRHDDGMDLRVRVVDADARSRAWSLSLGSVRGHQIELGWCEELALSDDHPLLWTHWHIEDQQLKVLTLGQSYLVAARFTAAEQ